MLTNSNLVCRALREFTHLLLFTNSSDSKPEPWKCLSGSRLSGALHHFFFSTLFHALCNKIAFISIRLVDFIALVSVLSYVLDPWSCFFMAHLSVLL